MFNLTINTMIDKEELYKKMSKLISKDFLNQENIIAVSDEQAQINKITSRSDVLSFIKSRYSDVAYNDDLKIHLIGLGGIGSYLAPLLGKIGRLSVEDFDNVSLDNILAQRYGFDQVGMSKERATEQLVPISEYDYKFSSSRFADIYISGVDNMKSRMDFAVKFVEKSQYKDFINRKLSKSEITNSPTLLIDVRMSPTIYEFFINTMQTIPAYIEKYMFHDKDATKGPCGAALKPQLSCVGAGVLVEYMKRIYNELQSDIEAVRKEAARGVHVTVYGGHFKIVEEPIM